MPIEFTKRVEGRLHDETLIWLTTVDAEGQPHSSLVWFLWDGTDFLIYSNSKTPKVRHVEANPRVALAFNSDAVGASVGTFTGIARIADDLPVTENEAYRIKYDHLITGLGMDAESFTREYDLPLRVEPTALRSW